MARYIFRECVIGLIRNGERWNHPYETPVELTDAEVEQIREAGAMHAIVRVEPMVAPTAPAQAEAQAAPSSVDAPAPAAPAPAPAAEDDGDI